MKQQKNYYESLETKWIQEYPSSSTLEEVWEFFKECGYEEPQKTFKNLLAHVTWNCKRVLDFGCDTGLLLSFICSLYPEIKGFGIDINGSAIAKAQTNFPHLEFNTFNGLEIPFDDGYFDLVFMSAVLKHIRYEDRDQIYNEIRRVSKMVLVIEQDCQKKKVVENWGWTFYHSNFEKELASIYKPVMVFKEEGDLLGLYSTNSI